MYLQQGHYLHNDKYQLLNVLGEGGFSLTYRGLWKTEVQGDLGRLPTYLPVCIKEYFLKDYCNRNPQTFFVEANTESGKEFFEKNKEKVIREAEILSEIHHPNVVGVLEVFKQNNTVYIVMEFIAGHSLRQEVEQNGVIDEGRLKKIIYKIGQALEYIHEKNILHLDIKPNNILIDKSGNPKLIDFGISKRYGFSNDYETSTMLLAASKGYASVEQYDSDAMQVFSPRPDIYSLGATMYFLLTGQAPTESILRPTKGLTPPRELNPAITEETERVVLKAMELNAENRYATVREMLLDLGFNPETDAVDLSEAATAEEETYHLMHHTDGEIFDADAEDNTIINPEIINRRSRRYNRIATLIAAALFIGAALFIIFRDEKSGKVAAENSAQQIFPADTVKPSENPVSRDLSETVPAEIHENRTTKTNNEPLRPKTETEIAEENFTTAFNDALQSYTNRDYTKAIELFRAAEKIKKTDTTEKYISLCHNEIEKIDIQKRKNLYDNLMNFGNFVVVKKKSDGTYGAIDERGNEVISCVYVSSMPSGETRLFQRKDDLYDKYDASGKLLEEGISGFD
jgi:serine/threonine-protein kinase